MSVRFRRIVAVWLKHARALQRLTQIELATRAGIPQSTVSALENEGHVVSDEILDQLAVGLGITVVELLDQLSMRSRSTQERDGEDQLPPGKSFRMGKIGYYAKRTKGPAKDTP
jgi:transcriptional regulator with XRE-family HTH domain